MTIPRVKILKQDGQTGSVKPSGDGICAIIAPAALGTNNIATPCAKPATAYASFGDGPLAEAGATIMNQSGNPTVLIKSAASTAGSVGTITTANGGTSTFTDSSSVPVDDFDVVILFTTGGTRGTAGAVYQVSLDGGATFGGKTALGTAITIAIPNTGVTIAIAAGTMLAGQTVSFSVKGPRMTNTDLGTALEALRVYAGAWECVYVHADADATMLATLDAWLIAREQEGRFKFGFMNSRARTPATETEAQFLTAMTTAWSASASTRISVGGDYCDLVAAIRKIVQKRPVQLPIAARTMSIPISRMSGYVNDGPLNGVSVADSNANPKWHDEAINPGLDDLRLTVLRSHDSKAGVFVNLPRVFSQDGSDYVFVPQLRVMNKACAIAYAILAGELQRGVRKDPATSKILEVEALYLEALVNTQFAAQLVTPAHVSAAKFVMARNDDLSANTGAILTCEIRVNGLAYVIEFDVSAFFVKSI